MGSLQKYSIEVQALIIASSIVIIALIINAFLIFSKFRVTPRFVKYITAFSSGFLLITALVGQFVAARDQLTNHWITVNTYAGDASDLKSSEPTLPQSMQTIGIVLGGFVVGLIIVFVIKKITKRLHVRGPLDSASTEALESFYEHQRHNAKHQHHEIKNKFAGIFMILSHRVPAGLAMGMLLFQSNQPGGMIFAFSGLVVFILHIIPEMILLYYAFLETTKNRLKAAIFAILVKLVFIPLILVGVWIGKATYANINFYWVMPFLFAAVTIILVWAVISELIPEFISLGQSNKEALTMSSIFMVGLILSALIQLVHHH